MSMPKMHPQDLMPLSKFFGALPHVKPRLAAGILDQLCNAVVEGKDAFDYGGFVIQCDDMNRFVLSSGGVDRITPEGADLFAKIYLAAGFPMKTKAPGELPKEISEYIQSSEALHEKQRIRAAALVEYESKLQHPESIPEADFTYSLLNDLFWKHIGKGGGVMTIGGIEVRKHISSHRSNSGKQRDFQVSYEWTSPTQGLQSVGKPSAYAGNRRNDADRNWGLGRE